MPRPGPAVGRPGGGRAAHRPTAGRRPAPPETGALPAARPGPDGTLVAGNRRIRRHRLRSDEAAGNTLLVAILFWAMLATSVAVWVFDTPPGSLATNADVITAVGRVTGMIGGFLLIAQVILASRMAWLEQAVGGRSLMSWHRWIGTSLLVMLLAHGLFITYGFALKSNLPLLDQVKGFIAVPDLLTAIVATGILALVGLMAIRGIRKRMRYEIWHALHLSVYGALILAYGHQFTMGSNLTDGFGYWYWTALYALAIAALAWGRVIDPLWFNLRHKLTVAEVVVESPASFSIYLTGRNLDRLGARAGQYFRWRFLAGDGWWQSHPFSLSAPPNGRWLRLTVTAVGDHTRALRELQPGTRVLAEGPSGVFTAERRTRSRALMIAVGSGISPVRALLEEMPSNTVLIYRARTESDLALRQEIEAVAARRGMRVEYVLGRRTERGPRELSTAGGLEYLVPDIAERDVYLCGPRAFVTGTMDNLRQLGVPPRQIHLDPFEL
ncbi:oxidoreductase [Pilimelia anulata]|uniref:Oxidoreductase n=1 Tax=Pilimelia anulata TaxID=53371 RepID=A0A8J3B3Z9_9ACTN|nr:ferredoxin reductase family protein [Pilimelia anulata]GGJ77910.1 oxidoreductase [Pilimelia anulata]